MSESEKQGSFALENPTSLSSFLEIPLSQRSQVGRQVKEFSEKYSKETEFFESEEDEQGCEVYTVEVERISEPGQTLFDSGNKASIAATMDALKVGLTEIDWKKEF
jgi:hypothetical protein